MEMQELCVIPRSWERPCSAPEMVGFQSIPARGAHSDIFTLMPPKIFWCCPCPQRDSRVPGGNIPSSCWHFQPSIPGHFRLF